MSQTQNPNPAQQALEFIGAALTEHRNNIAKMVGPATAESFHARAQAAMTQIAMGLATATTTPAQAITPPSTARRERKRVTVPQQEPAPTP